MAAILDLRYKVGLLNTNHMLMEAPGNKCKWKQEAQLPQR